MEVITKAVWFSQPSSGLTNWVLADNDNCPANIQQEIAAEIIDNDVQETNSFQASNGCYYRWSDL